LKPLPLLIFALSLSLLAASAQTAGGYHVIKKIPIPGEGSWDYLTVDEAARRLYVSHGTQVEVLDVDSGAIVGKIANTLGVHGIAIAPELGRGFVSNGQSSTVTIFDLKTLKTIAEVPTGKKPDAIIYDPATSRVFALMAAATAPPPFRRRMGKWLERSILAAVPSLPRPTAPAMSTIISKTKAWY
jgi:YVTN family beta-propeller protein